VIFVHARATSLTKSVCRFEYLYEGLDVNTLLTLKMEWIVISLVGTGKVSVTLIVTMNFDINIIIRIKV
jgi:hypothetical protein